MKNLIITGLITLMPIMAVAQDTLRLTLSQAIEIAQKQAPQAISAQHSLRSSYWSYRSFKANYRPSVSMTSTPTFNRGITRVLQPDGTNSFVHVSELSTNATLQVSQNIAPTGGNLFMKSSLYREDVFDSNIGTQYSSQPVVIGYQQTLFGYNDLKWEKKIEPLYWQKAKKQYAESMELVASQASNYFFNLASAQTQCEIAKSNLESANTLCSVSEGRYNLGTITENEMLQLQLNQLNEETNLLNAGANLQSAMDAFRTFLDLPITTVIVVQTDGNIPEFNVPLAQALEMAIQNSPDPDYYKSAQIQSRSNLEYVKANTHMKADLYVQFGLSQSGDGLNAAYQSPTDLEYGSVSVSIPILDWGRNKGRRRVAESNVALTDVQSEQGMKSFEQNVTKMVQQFNLQSRRVEVAAMTDEKANRRYEVARQLYVNGKNTIIDLNMAISEKDAARTSYISSLSTYWSLYYGLRSMTGYDFANDCEIMWELPDDIK